MARAKVDPASVGHVVIGSVIHGEARDMYMARVAAIDAGLSVDALPDGSTPLRQRTAGPASAAAVIRSATAIRPSRAAPRA